MSLLTIYVKPELMLGIAFIAWGLICIIFNKRSGRMYVEFQKGWGLGKSAYAVGRFISICGGAIALLIGLMMIFVPRK
jgi:uncharacterized membrane protein HdeD (DUF308 family)